MASYRRIFALICKIREIKCIHSTLKGVGDYYASRPSTPLPPPWMIKEQLSKRGEPPEVIKALMGLSMLDHMDDHTTAMFLLQDPFLAHRLHDAYYERGGAEPQVHTLSDLNQFIPSVQAMKRVELLKRQGSAGDHDAWLEEQRLAAEADAEQRLQEQIAAERQAIQQRQQQEYDAIRREAIDGVERLKRQRQTNQEGGV